MSIHIQRKHESYHIPKTRTRQPAASSLVAAAVASRSAPAQHVKLEGAYTLPGEAPKWASKLVHMKIIACFCSSLLIKKNKQ